MYLLTVWWIQFTQLLRLHLSNRANLRVLYCRST